VIEGVERIQAELQLAALAEQPERLLQPQIPVVDSGLNQLIPPFLPSSHGGKNPSI
jgi:hypothetical protein